MSVSRDIMATWRRPRRVMRGLLAMGRREDRALAFLFAACALIFVAQLPRLSREDALRDSARLAADQKASDLMVTLQVEIGITFFMMLFVWPLLLYGLGSLLHILARLFGGRGSFYTARLALFWSLLAASPAWLFQGLVAGFVGPGPGEQIAGLIVLAALVLFVSICLREAETNPEGAT